MIEFGDTTYYFDLNKLDELITIQKKENYKEEYDTEKKEIYDSFGSIISSEVISKQYQKNKEIDVVKYELYKNFIDYVIDYDGIDDDSLGSERALDQTSFSFKIVFNTLLSAGIIKEQ